jgi:hypothetical protein
VRLIASSDILDLKQMPFDVVIPCGPKDRDCVQTCISSTRRFISDVRNIYVVTDAPMDLSGATYIDESIFPFAATDIDAILHTERTGWYLQQLIKLHAPFVIPGILETVLWLDADTVFNKRIKFVEPGRFLFNAQGESQKGYLDHMKRLHPSFEVWKRGLCGVTNLMIVHRPILAEIFKKVEDHHEKEFWLAFLSCVTEVGGAGASEYDIYFNYIMRNHSSKARIRNLRWNNFGQRGVPVEGDWDYVSCHWHVQRKLTGRERRLISTE